MSNLNDAREEANRYAKARQMTEQGYTARPVGEVEGTYFVQNPKGDLYIVMFFDNAPARCQCPDWKERERDCKHIMWLRSELETAAQLAQYEAEYGACELESTGIDPYPQY